MTGLPAIVVAPLVRTDIDIFPTFKELEHNFEKVEIHPWQITHDCKDGFLAAYWRRPEAYLDPHVRRAISTFSKLTNLDQGLNKLATDLKDGTWKSKNEAILNAEWFDAGYILIVADIE